MSSTTITVKPNNHRIHPCENSKKLELLNKLIAEESSSDIIVVCLQNSFALKDALDDKSVKVMEDKELYQSKDLNCEVLISFDIPDKAIMYMARASKGTVKIIALVDKAEQKKLYPIEMLLGRVIKQDIIEGFEYTVEKVVEEPAFKGKKLSREDIKKVAKKRYEDKTQDKPKKEFSNDKKSYDKDDRKKEYKPRDKKDFKKSDSSDKWAKKNKTQNKFLGKDENGKAIFSGKSGDRNHRYDGTAKDKYDAPSKVGRKINVKLKREPKEPS